MEKINNTGKQTVAISLRQEGFHLENCNKSIGKRASFVSSSLHSKVQRLEKRE